MLPTQAHPAYQDCAAIILAGGDGTRFGGMKQFGELRGRRVVDFAIAAARTKCAQVVLVVPKRVVDRPQLGADIVVAGGNSRSASVRAGLAAVDETKSVIVVHDAARPLASPALFLQVIERVLKGADAAIPGVAVTDTLRRRDGKALGVTRDELVAVQTPQAFSALALRKAHASSDAEATDDATLIDRQGGTVVVVPGEHANFKITEAIDLLVADVLAADSGRIDEIEMPHHG